MTIESTRLRRLREAGVSIWLDTLSRDLIESGDLAELAAAGVTGATSNPTISPRRSPGPTATTARRPSSSPPV